MDDTSTLVWWLFIVTILAAVVLVGALAVAMGLAVRQRLRDQRALSRRLLEAQEQERARVAREVHDDAVQRLVALRREIELMGREPGGPAPRQLDGLEGEVDDLMVSLRRLAHGLHPAVLTQGGLADALRQAADSALETWGLQVTCALPDGPVEATRERQLALFRITQEALRNAALHGRATEARIRVTVDDDLLLEVSDAGRGFDQVAPGSGLGLIAMGERARLEGGVLEVRSATGKGTVVTARFPR